MNELINRIMEAPHDSRPAIEEISVNGSLVSQTSYDDLHDLITRRAAVQFRAGIRAGQIIGLVVANTLESVVDLLGLMLVGAPVVIVDVHDPLSRRQEQLSHLCQGQWESGELIPRIPRAMYDLAEPAAVIVYTTGSTAASKPVAQPSAAMLANALSLAGLHDLQSGASMACALPISHCNGLGLGVLAPLLAGASCQLFRGFNAPRYLAALAQHRTTHATTVPSLLQALLREEAWPALDLSYFISAAAALSKRTATDVYHRGYPVMQGYGLSECMNFATGMSHLMPQPEYVKRMFTGEIPPVGPAIPGVEIGMRNIGEGQLGEVMVKGHLMAGYVDNPEATAEVLNGGWLATGDIGRVDAEGWVTLVGRIKNVAKCGGFSISLEEIDRWVQGLDGVDDAVAVSRPDDRLGEAVTVYSVGVADEKAIARHVADRYGAGVIGLRVEIIDAIPRLRNGKVARPQLAVAARS